MCNNIIPIKNRHQRDEQNSLIKTNTAIAIQAVNTLLKSGYTVMKTSIDKNKPVVWIQNCPICKRLNGTWFTRSNTSKGVTCVMQAEFEGATVKWLSNYSIGVAS